MSRHAGHRSRGLRLWTLLILSSASLVATPLMAAGPAAAVPPLHCLDDPDQDGCPFSSDGADGEGRTFLLDGDVRRVSGAYIDVWLNPDEWDSSYDFRLAMQDWWNLNNATAICTFCDTHCVGTDITNYNQYPGYVTFKVWKVHD